MELRDVFPIQAESSLADVDGGNAISAREFGPRRTIRSEFPNRANVGFGQLGAFVQLTTLQSLGMQAGAMTISRCLPSLGNHIARVLRRSTEKEVIWTNTQRVVAAVTHEHTSGYRSVSEHPSNAMRGIKAAITRSPARVYLELTVGETASRRAGSTDPNPAIAGFIDLRPETLFDGTAGILAGHFRFLSRIGGAVPPAVPPARGLPHAPNFTAFGGCS